MFFFSWFPPSVFCFFTYRTLCWTTAQPTISSPVGWAVAQQSTLPASAQFLRQDQSLLHDHPFQRPQPVMVVGCSQIRIALLLSFGDLPRQYRRPFRPCEMAGFVKLYGHGEGLRFPRLA